MAIKQIQKLRDQSNLIKNETRPRGNTTMRVGGNFLDIVDTFDELLNKPSNWDQTYW